MKNTCFIVSLFVLNLVPDSSEVNVVQEMLKIVDRLKGRNSDWKDFCENKISNMTDEEFYFDFFYGSYTVPTARDSSLTTLILEEAKYLINFIDEVKTIHRKFDQSAKLANDTITLKRGKRQAGDQTQEIFSPYVGAIFYTFPILQFSIPFGGPVKLLGISLYEN